MGLFNLGRKKRSAAGDASSADANGNGGGGGGGSGFGRTRRTHGGSSASATAMPSWWPRARKADASSSTTSSASAVSRLRAQIELLERREQFLLQKVDAEQEKAQAALKRKRRDDALLCLRRKKLYSTHIEANAGAREKLEQQVMAIEAAHTNRDVHSAIVVGNRELRQLREQVSVRRVDDAMADLQDMLEEQKDVTLALTQPLSRSGVSSSLVEADEDELEAELAELEADQLDATLLRGTDDSSVERELDAMARLSARDEGERDERERERQEPASVERRADVERRLPQPPPVSAAHTRAPERQPETSKSSGAARRATVARRASSSKAPSAPSAPLASSESAEAEAEEERELRQLAANWATEPM